MLAALLAVLIGAIDLSIIATILPQMVADLNVNSADIDRYIWIVNAYLIAYIAAIPITGRLSDLLGRRSIFLACLAIFLTGSIVCAAADSLDSMIIARAVQGFGGGGLLPVTMALAGDLLPRRSHLAAIGAIASVDTLGWIAGPVYGAAIVQLGVGHPSAWRWVFWLNIPIILVTTWAIRARVPGPSLRQSLSRIRSLDIPGATCLTLAIVFGCLALTASGELSTSTDQGLRAFGGTPNPIAGRIWQFAAIAVVFVVLFVLRTKTAAKPILPPHLFRQPAYRHALFGNFMLGIMIIIGIVTVPVVVALLVATDDASWTSALLLAPYTTGIAAMSFAGGWIERHYPQRTVLISGALAATGGFAVMYPLLDSLHVWWMLPGLLVAGIGIGVLIAPLGSVALITADASDRGAATSTLMVARLLGMTIGISGLSAIGVARLQQLTNQLPSIVRGESESTANFLVRQQEFIHNEAIPVAVQVMQELFVLAAVISLLLIIPLLAMYRWLRRSGAA